MTNIPHVLHIVPALFDKRRGAIGGAERYVYELARHMADVVPTELLTFGDKGCEETVGKLRIRIAGNPWYVRGRDDAFSPPISVVGAGIFHLMFPPIVSITDIFTSVNTAARCLDIRGNHGPT